MNQDRLYELAKKVSWRDIEAHLRGLGWSESEPQPTRPGIAMLRGPQGSVLVPRDPALEGDMLAKVAALRCAIDISDDPERAENELIHPGHDVLLFALEGYDMLRGSVLLESGASLLQNAARALRAAACSVERPGEAFYSRTDLKQTEAFMQRCRMGQTRFGSFVASVYCPIQPEEQQQIVGQPFGRSAVESLLLQTYQTVEALRDNPTGELSPDAIPCSANLCEALALMASAPHQDQISISAAWSPRLAHSAHIPSRVTLAPSLAEPLRRRAEQLRPKEQQARARLVGNIWKLEGSRSEEGVAGRVLLHVFQDGSNKALRAWCELAPDVYRIACNAHLDSKLVVLHGTLEREGRSWVVRDPEDFQVEQVED